MVLLFIPKKLKVIFNFFGLYICLLLFIQSFSLRKGFLNMTDVQHMLQVIAGSIREIVRLASDDIINVV